ncbi:MAG: beta-galactosidase [Chthoniobacterales bacterium]|nr:beta-galactosidase [Chthoniobacterales bacterium]
MRRCLSLSSVVLGLSLCSLASLFGQAPAVPAPTPEREAPPLLTKEQREELANLDDLLRQSRQSTAAVRLNEFGVLELLLNGKPKPPLIGGLKPWVPPHMLRVKIWKHANYDLVWLPVEFSHGSYRYGHGQRSFWDGPGRYLREDVQNALSRVLTTYPNAKIILWPLIDVYAGWDDAHPDDLQRTEKGETRVGTSHFERIGVKDPAKKAERHVWSGFSKAFREDTGEALRELIHTVETSLYGKRVVGYVLGGGQDWQLYSWEPPNGQAVKDPALLGDYSKPALAAWAEWLKAKYETPERLSTAWNRPVADFAAATPPGVADLSGPEEFFNYQTERRNIDWRRFHAEGRAEFVEYFARVAREAAGPDKLIGVCAGDGGPRIGLTANGLLLRSKNIDLAFAQPGYGPERRAPGSPGGIAAIPASYGLHGKLLVADMDHQTWMIPNTEGRFGTFTISSNSRGYARDAAELGAMWRRELALLWQNSAGGMFHPIYGDLMLEHPTIWEEAAAVRKILSEFAFAPVTKPLGDVAVIYDERSVSYLKQGLVACPYEWTSGQQMELNSSGIPYRAYYADDFREGLVPPAKVYIFSNVLDFDDRFVKNVEAAKQAGATLVWMQGSGYAQRTTDPARISQTCGIDLAPFENEAPAAPAEAVPSAGARPFVVDKAVLSRQPIASPGGVALQVTDPSAQSVQTYPNSSKVAIAVRRTGSSTSLFVGGFMLSRDMLVAIVRDASAWQIAPIGNAVAVGPNWLSIHPSKTGVIPVRLDRPAALQAVPPFSLTSPSGTDHKLTLNAGKTYWFKITD